MAKTKRGLQQSNEDEKFDNLMNDNSGLLTGISVNIKCKNENQKKLINSIRDNEVTICSGLAGCGKTFLACAEALKLLIKYPKIYKNIVLVKSVKTLRDEELGFLKGTLEEKMAPYMYSFYHNFEKIIGESKVNRLKMGGVLKELPIAYIRGINIDNSIVIIDEAQNITLDNMRTILTRLGDSSKMILLGDERQIDLKNKKDSSLRTLIDKFSSLPEIGTIAFNPEDVVRNPLIIKIEKIFDELG